MAAKRRPHPPAEDRIERIERANLVIRGERVMLDEDLAELYGTTTKRLNEQVTRNAGRFPDDFAFRLTQKEFMNLRSQIATSRWGGRRHPPRAFTEHGAVMLASVLDTPVAVQASLHVVRAFVRMRELARTHDELARRLAELEQTVGRHDQEIGAVLEAIRRLIEAPTPARRRIGFGREAAE